MGIRSSSSPSTNDSREFQFEIPGTGINHWAEILAVSAVATLTVAYLIGVRNRVKTSDALLKQFKNIKLHNKTIVVTGSNRGIGRATAEFIASKGAHVILGCRNMSDCQRAAEQIIAKTGNPRVTPSFIDLSDIESIEKFAASIEKCHLLINNASVMVGPQRQFKKDIELTMLTNHIGPTLLTKLLIPKLVATSIEDNIQTRIVNVGSRLEKVAKISESDYSWIRSGPINPYSTWTAYGNSKLCTLLSSAAISTSGELTMEAGSNVTINTVTPGIVNTDLGRWAPAWQRMLGAPLMYLFLRSPLQGAASVIHSALAPEISHLSGKFFYDGYEITPSQLAQSEQLAKQVHLETSLSVNTTECLKRK